MSQDDMKAKIFEPIMKDVVCLIKEQIKMAGDGVAAVIMVGGFGQSKYLKSRIKDAISSRTDVLQPESGWTAVVKGAAMHGLSRYQSSSTRVEVASRVARRSYGTCLMTRYDMMKHNPKEACAISFLSNNAFADVSQVLVRERTRIHGFRDVLVHPKGNLSLYNIGFADADLRRVNHIPRVSHHG